MYAAGGWTGGGRFTNTAEKYDPSTDSWSPVRSMHHARSYVPAVSISNAEVNLFDALIGRAEAAQEASAQ